MNTPFIQQLVRLLLGAMLGIAAAGWAQQDDTRGGGAERTSDDGGRALAMEIRGAIGPATSSFILQGLRKAEDEGYKLVLIEIDTPGGLVTSMRDIIKGILNSPVPVVSYVTPSGSRAMSAGTYILYASHVAAMSPATHLGAATPVQIGPAPPVEPEGPADQKDKSDKKDGDSETGAEGTQDSAEPAPPPGDAMERKVLNDAVAYIRELAALRGRNADWAEAAVVDAATLGAEKALEMNVIDVIAANRGDLLEKIDGRQVSVNGLERTLASRNLLVETLEPDWRTELLGVITDPNVAYLLLMIGIYGLIFEGYNPGAIVPGVVGAICLLLALFAFQVLSVNYAGLALMLLGVLLMAAEAFAPSFGALGLGGIIAFVIGSIILMDTDVPGFGVSKPLIGGIALVSGGLVLGTIAFALRSRRAAVVSGREYVLGQTAEVISDFVGEGAVRIQGEVWTAKSSVPLAAGQRVKVVAMDGLVLGVEPLSDQEQ